MSKLTTRVSRRAQSIVPVVRMLPAARMLTVAILALPIACDSPLELPGNRTITGATVSSEGGLVISSDGLMELIFPAGAVSAPTMITIDVVDDFSADDLVSAIYRFGPTGMQFEAPVIARLSVPNVNASRVVFANVDGPTPVPAEASIYSPDDGIVEAVLRHFSSYGAFDESCMGAWIDGDGFCRSPDSTNHPQECCDDVYQCIFPYADTCPEGEGWECVCAIGSTCDFGICQAEAANYCLDSSGEDLCTGDSYCCDPASLHAPCCQTNDRPIGAFCEFDESCESGRCTDITHPDTGAGRICTSPCHIYGGGCADGAICYASPENVWMEEGECVPACGHLEDGTHGCPDGLECTYRGIDDVEGCFPSGGADEDNHCLDTTGASVCPAGTQCCDPTSSSSPCCGSTATGPRCGDDVCDMDTEFCFGCESSDTPHVHCESREEVNLFAEVSPTLTLHSCVGSRVFIECYGPEDCPTGQECIIDGGENGYAFCATIGDYTYGVACSDNSDCPAESPVCEDYDPGAGGIDAYFAPFSDLLGWLPRACVPAEDNYCLGSDGTSTCDAGLYCCDPTSLHAPCCVAGADSTGVVRCGDDTCSLQDQYCAICEIPSNSEVFYECVPNFQSWCTTPSNYIGEIQCDGPEDCSSSGQCSYFEGDWVHLVCDDTFGMATCQDSSDCSATSPLCDTFVTDYGFVLPTKLCQ